MQARRRERELTIFQNQRHEGAKYADEELDKVRYGGGAGGDRMGDDIGADAVSLRDANHAGDREKGSWTCSRGSGKEPLEYGGRRCGYGGHAGLLREDGRHTNGQRKPSPPFASASCSALLGRWRKGAKACGFWACAKPRLSRAGFRWCRTVRSSGPLASRAELPARMRNARKRVRTH